MGNSIIENRVKAQLDALGLSAEELLICQQMGIEPEDYARTLEKQAMEDEIEQRTAEERMKRVIESMG
jgi:hypothetical protein